MDLFLNAVATYPTVVLTVLLGVVVGYWIIALVTGVAFDSADALTGGLKAAGDGVAGAIKGTTEALAGGGETDGGHSDGGLLSLLGVGRVPVTITFSLMSLMAWTVCTLGTLWFEPGHFVSQSALLILSLVLGLLAASVLLRPLGRALDQSKPARRRDCLGQFCTITSGKVDGGFGTGHVDDGGAGLNVHVLCSKANALKKGDRALLVDYDPAKDVYEVEPIDWLLPQEVEALNDPARAAQIISSRVRRR